MKARRRILGRALPYCSAIIWARYREGQAARPSFLLRQPMCLGDHLKIAHPGQV